MEVPFSTLHKFQPKQLEAWTTLFDKRCKYLLYGGSAGCGKSYFLRWSALGLALYYTARYKLKDVPIGLFSEDYPTLKDRQVIKIKHEFPSWLGELKETRDEGFAFVGKPKYGRFLILLRNLDDPSKYSSVEFAAECVEELTKNIVGTFEDLRFRLRYPEIDDVKFVGATNPGEVGHSFVKKLWIEPDPKHPDLEQDRFFFIPAHVYDNEFVGGEYVKQLQALPDQKRKAWLDGSWDVFEGQVFSEWGRETHVVEPFMIEKSWHRYIGIDWGVNKPLCVVWIAENQDGRMFVYRELYMNGDEFERTFGKPLTPKRLANIIKLYNKKDGERHQMTQDDIYEYAVADPSMWNQAYFGKGAKALEGGESIAEVMSDAGLKMLKGDNDRINGLAKFRGMLALAPDGKPWFQVFKSCYNVGRTLPSLVYDKTRVEDVDTDGEDHAYDSLRYVFMSRPAKPEAIEKPKETPLSRRYKKLTKKLSEGEDEYDSTYY